MPAIYHITHIRNLPLILQHGCLWCDNEKAARQVSPVGIAHEHIKRRRAARIVPANRGGTLADYVPFYFAPRSPMLYTINRGNVEGYDEGQGPVLHLVSSTERVAESGLPFTFTNGHAEMVTSSFYEDLADLDKVDWEIMKATFWNDTPEDGTRKWRRQAEFLVHNQFPVELIAGIGVISNKIADSVKQILAETGHQIQVAARPNWYY
jgi:hypothetical protein